MRSPFDLARFLAGEPAVTGYGFKARYEAHIPDAHSSDRVLFSIDLPGHGRKVFHCDESGKAQHVGYETDAHDLFMAPRVAIAA